MSSKAVGWALEQHMPDAVMKLVLISLADAHNGGTGKCFPSLDYIAKQACTSRSTVIRKLKALEEQGWITVEPNHEKTGRQTSNAYVLHIEKRSEGEGVTVTPLPGGGCQADTPEGVTAMTPPYIEPEEEPNPPEPPLAEEFEKVVRAWPKLTPSQEAEAWEVFSQLKHVEKAKCIAAGNKYPAKCRQEAARRGRTMEAHAPFTKSLPNWIKERHWEGDKPLPSTAGLEPLTHDHPLYDRCCEIEGKVAARVAKGWHFKAATVAAARAETGLG